MGTTTDIVGIDKIEARHIESISLQWVESARTYIPLVIMEKDVTREDIDAVLTFLNYAQWPENAGKLRRNHADW